MPFEVFILGNNSAIPAHGRHPTSQVVNHHEKFYLVDCGEGTQIQLSKYKIKRSRLDHIFISHLHGDHYFGLIGLITSFHLLRREKPLHIYAPKGLKEILEMQLNVSDTKLVFELIFHETKFDSAEILLENDDLTISSFPVKHRIPTTGFLFREKNIQRKVRTEKLEAESIPHELIVELKKGKDVFLNEKKYLSAEWTFPPASPRSYAFCADTLYHEELKNYIQGCNLVYHEATFMEESSERAKQTFHSTAKQAATMAQIASVKHLLLGHFSAKYEDLLPLLIEAKEIFAHTKLAIEGLKFEVE